MDAVLSIDTTKGNRIINHRGLALSPTAHLQTMGNSPAQDE
jgi:hypothetical protein